MSAILNVSRRGFLKGAASASAFVLCVRFLPDSLHAEGLAGERPKSTAQCCIPASSWESIPDGTVYIVAHRSEMGTTSRTSVPMILADELDADWKRVKLEQALGDERYGSQNTDGSHSIREFLRAHAPGRRHRANDAHASSRQTMGSSGVTSARPICTRSFIRLRDAASVTANLRHAPPQSCRCLKTKS